MMTNEEAIRAILFAKRDVLADSDTDKAFDMAIEALKAQPIYCKDCEYWKTGTVSKICTRGIITSIMNRGDDYCSYAERRTDG